MRDAGRESGHTCSSIATAATVGQMERGSAYLHFYAALFDRTNGLMDHGFINPMLWMRRRVGRYR